MRHKIKAENQRIRSKEKEKNGGVGRLSLRLIVVFVGQ